MNRRHTTARLNKPTHQMARQLPTTALHIGMLELLYNRTYIHPVIAFARVCGSEHVVRRVRSQ